MDSRGVQAPAFVAPFCGSMWMWDDVGNSLCSGLSFLKGLYVYYIYMCVYYVYVEYQKCEILLYIQMYICI